MKWYQNKLNLIAFIVGAAIIGYVFFMFISGFVSMSGLQTTLLEQARIETERRSAALAAFFTDRRDDLVGLASSGEMSAFFENMAPDQADSQQQELRVIPVNHRFLELINGRKVGSNPVYTRMVFFDEKGIILIDHVSSKPFMDAKNGLKAPPPPKNGDRMLFTIKANREIMISRPCYHQNVYKGQIVALIRSNIVYDHLFKDEQIPDRKAFVLTEGKELLKGSPADPGLSGVPDLGEIETGKPFEFAAVTSDGVKRKSYALRFPIKDTPFSLVSITAAIESYGRLSTWHLVFWMIVLATTIFGGTIFLMALRSRFNDARGRIEALEEKNQQLLAETEKRMDFLATVAHELKTPLSSVLVFSESIKKKMEESILPKLNAEDEQTNKVVERLQDNINTMLSEGRRLSALINNVYDMAKFESGKIDWQMVSMSIEDIIAQAVTATAPIFAQKDISLTKDVESNLPSVTGDRDRLVQVLVNLLSNAVRFTEHGIVTLAAKQSNGEIIVSVIDSGIGIAEEDKQKIFEKYRQANGALTRQLRGTGLGLAICRQIIEHHGGKIWVESETGKGSTFSFNIPLK